MKKSLLLLKDKKVLLLAIGLLLCVLIGLYAWLVLSNTTVSDTDHRKIMAQADFLTSDNKLAEVEPLLQEHLTRKLTEAQTTETTLAMAVNYENLENPQAAYEWYQRYEALHPTLTGAIALSMADAAIKLGDKEAGIRYLEKAIELAPNDPDPFNDAYISSYKRALKQLRNNQTPKAVEYRLR